MSTSCKSRKGVPCQQTVKLIKVKTWTWHSNLTELAYLDVSKLSSNVSCLSNGKIKNKTKKIIKKKNNPKTNPQGVVVVRLALVWPDSGTVCEQIKSGLHSAS